MNASPSGPSGPVEPTGTVAVRRALVSVYDKTGLPELARGLSDHGVELVSTGSTARAIREAGVEVTEVGDVTGFPEILDGRVKTLHPAVHAGILADRSKPEHLATLDEHGIAPIELVVVNLYPFAETVADPEVTTAEAIEMIDIGGPTLVRAAAKNHAHVGVVTSPRDYPGVLGHLRDDGGLPPQARRHLATRAFAHTAAYDAAVSGWMRGGDDFPPVLVSAHRKVQELRYGENPHQRAAYYRPAGPSRGLGSARQLHGKELSYNNLLDTDAAWVAAGDFAEPCVAIVKHTNPAGLALGATLAEAYPKALAGDPTSAFGGIVAANRTIDGETARQVVEVFTEVVVAPGFTGEALEVLTARKNLRLLEVPGVEAAAGPGSGPGPGLVWRSVSGGLLLQDADAAGEDEASWSVPTAAKPDEALMAELRFAWTAAKHVKSNAIVLARERAVVGVGAGQMSRVDSVGLAVEKSGGRHAGAVLASDAFFPFRDGPDRALEAGVVALVSPGGSVRDDEVVAACDERGVPMVFTGRRHFRH